MIRSEEQHFAIPDDMPALQPREPRTCSDTIHVGQRLSPQHHKDDDRGQQGGTKALGQVLG